MSDFLCKYIKRNGETCNNKAQREKGCHQHWERQSHIPCRQGCGRYTRSSIGMCTTCHIQRQHASAAKNQPPVDVDGLEYQLRQLVLTKPEEFLKLVQALTPVPTPAPNQ